MALPRLILLVLVVGALLAPVPASAIDLGQWVQGLKVSPYITERLEYQTNIFLQPSRAEDDVISRTVPGFLVTIERGPLTFGVGYRAEILRFMDHENQNNTHHLGSVDLRVKFGSLSTSLHHDFTLTTDPPTSELTGRISSTTVNLAPEIEYQITPRLSVGLTYQYTDVRFEKRAEQMNHTTQMFGAYTAWKFVPKADVRVGYTQGYSEFDFVATGGGTDRDASHRIIYIGLRGDITPKLSSTFRAGYEMRDQKDKKVQDESTLHLGGDWIYKPQDRTRITLSTTKTFENSIFGLLNETVTYEQSIIGLTVDHQFAPKLRAYLRGSGNLSEYPRKEITIREPNVPKFREDTIVSWGTGIDYDIQKWLSVGAEYSHTRRDSTFDEFNYKDDKFTAKVTLQF